MNELQQQQPKKAPHHKWQQQQKVCVLLFPIQQTLNRKLNGNRKEWSKRVGERAAKQKRNKAKFICVT